MDQINDMPDELEKEENEAREDNQSTTERGDHSSFRPFEVQTLGGQVVRHKSEDQGEDLSDVDDRVEYLDDNGNPIGFGDANEQPEEIDEVDFIDIENLNNDKDAA